VKPTVEPDKIAAWVKVDVKAQALIVPSLNERQTSHVYNLNTSNEIWMKLKKINSDSSQLNNQHTLSKFFNYKITSDQSILDAYAEIEEISRSNNEMGVAMAESAVVTKIVSALNKEVHGSFKRTWDPVPDAEQTMDRLLSRLRKEELGSKTIPEAKQLN